MPPVPPRRRRARPVADAPIDPLLARSEDLAKGWLLALIEQAPLDDAAGIVGSGLNRDGPRICDAVLRAVSGETDLRRLEPGGALVPLVARVGELTGARSAAAVSRSVDALQGIVWAALRDELRAPDPDLVTELSERLALIAELIRAAALEHADPGPAPERRRGPVLRSAPAPAAAQASDPTTRPGSDPAAEPPSAPAATSARPPAPAPDARAQVRVWPEAGDRAAGGEALWIGALEEEIVRSAGSGLSLLLAEFEDADRVSAVETPSAATATFGRFSAAVRSAVRRQDILVCETDSRAWVIARNTSHEGAHALADRIASALRRADGWRGAPLTAGVGVAVLGEDGRTGAELIEAAEEARFRATAAGELVDGGLSGGGPDDAPWDQ